MQYIYFKLLMRENRPRLFKKAGKNSQVLFDRFNQYDSVEALSNVLTQRIVSDNIRYVLLDGFDEFKALKDHDPDEIFRQVCEAVLGKGSNFLKVVITTRLELLSNGVSIVKQAYTTEEDASNMKTDIPVNIIKINHLNNRDIIKVYKNYSVISADKVDFSAKLRNRRLLKQHLKRVGNGHSLFRNSFFATRADSVLHVLRTEKMEQLTVEAAFHIIVNSCLDKEYAICASMNIVNKNELSADEFRNKLLPVHLSMAGIMLHTGRNYVRDTEIAGSINVEVLDYIHTRAMLVRDNGQLEFIHRMFFEYFIALDIQSLDFDTKRLILRGEKPEIDHKNILKFYTHSILHASPYLSFTKQQLQDSVECIEPLQFENMHRLITATKIAVKENSCMKMNDILQALPLADEAHLANYSLNGEDIVDYMRYAELDLSNQNLRTLEYLHIFGEIQMLDLQRNPITNFSGLLYLGNIRVLWISNASIPYIGDIGSLRIDHLIVPIKNRDELEHVLKECNASIFSFCTAEANSANIRTLYSELTARRNAGLNARVINLMAKSRMDEAVAAIDKLTFQDEIDKITNIIEFLNDAFEVASSSGFDEESNHEMRMLLNERAKQYARRGDLYSSRKQWKLALIDYMRAIMLNPHVTKYHYNYGYCWHWLDENKQAIKHYSKAIELAPDIADYYHLRGAALHHLSEYSEAFENKSKAIELEPHCSQFYDSRGRTLHKQEQYDKALADYSKAIELKPDEASYYCNRGETLQSLGRYKEALVDYSKAIELAPNEVGYYYSRAMLLQSALNRYDSALMDFNKIIELNPVNASYYYKRGMTFRFIRQFVDALNDYDKAIELKSEHASYYHMRGQTLRLLKRYDEALEDFNMAIRLSPDISIHYISRGELLHATEQYSQALEEKNKAIELNLRVNDGQYYHSKAATLHALGQNDDAIKNKLKAIELQPQYRRYYSRQSGEIPSGQYVEMLNKYSDAIKQSPTQADHYHNRSLIFLHDLAQCDLALADCSKAIELEPARAEFYYSRSLIMHEMEEYYNALEDCSMAIQLKPDQADYYYNRGEALFNLAKYSQALESYSAATELEPYNASHYFSRGKTFEMMDEIEKALENYSMAIELEPGGVIYCRRRGQLFSNQFNQYEDALRDYSRIIELEPNNSDNYDLRGRILYIMEQYEGAINDFSRAIELSEDSRENLCAFYYCNRGAIRHKLENYEQALVDFSMAVKLAPDARYEAERSDTLRMLNKYDQALEDELKVMEYYPYYRRSYWDSDLTLSRGKYDRALDDYKHLIELEPSNAKYYNGRGNILCKNGQPEQAIKDYRKAIELNAGCSEYYYNLGEASLLLGENDEALVNYTMAIQLEPDCANYYYRRGELLRLLGHNEEAVTNCTRAIELEPTCAKYYNGRGTSLRLLDQDNEAAEDFAQAILLQTEPSDNADH